MADVLNREQRTRCMSSVRSRNTGPELRLRKALWARGLRYRLKSMLPGKPDLVFPGSRVAIFVDGCFWHQCPIHKTSPKTNAEFWAAKLESNVRRDREVDAMLVREGWTVMRIWQHELKDLTTVVERVERTVAKAKV
jgi:DNA mismatch endonuclease (patch repair protein)